MAICCKMEVDIVLYFFVLRQHRGKFSTAKVYHSYKGHPFWNPGAFWQQLVYSQDCWELTSALVNLEQVSDSRPVPSNASVHLWILEGCGVSSVLTPSSPLAWILALPTPFTVSCPSNQLLSLIHTRALQDMSPSQPARMVMLCYPPLSVPFSNFSPNCRLTLHYSCVL